MINEFDLYNDDLASYRLNTYLTYLLDGISNDKERNKILDDAAQKYADKWGSDKVILV